MDITPENDRVSRAAKIATATNEAVVYRWSVSAAQWRPADGVDLDPVREPFVS